MGRIARLEARLQVLEDVKSLHDLHVRYVRALADRDWEVVLDCYASDAVCDLRLHGVLRGREQIREMLGELAGIVQSRDAYVLSSPEIEVDGDRAFGIWTWHRHQCEFRTAFGYQRVWGPWQEGRYRCEYVRLDDGWKIAHAWFRVIRPDHDDDLAKLPAGAVIGAVRT
jgi:ketosteroid isomerase-like protein